MPEMTVASFNTHAGMDGWGRPYDLGEVCKALDADVVVLQEVFTPRDSPSQVAEIAGSLGCCCYELPLSPAWRRIQPIWHGKGWEPRKPLPNYQKAIKVGHRMSGTEARDGFEPGTWGLAVLSRVAAERVDEIELGRLRRDFTRRAALSIELPVPGDPRQRAVVVGFHAAHLTDGSPSQLRVLAERLPPQSVPAALAGDMNLWGPPLTLLFRGWRRGVRGRTWPARRPHSQLDHILVNEAVTSTSGQVLRAGNSDHRPVRCVIGWGK